MHIISQAPRVNLFDAMMAYREKQMQTVDFKTPITTIEQGKAWIAALEAAGMMFHFEDSPDDIINISTGKEIFTKAEAKLVAERVAELYDMDWTVTGHECPIGYALEVGDPEQYAATLDHLSEEFDAFTTVHHLPQDEDAWGLIHGTLTERQRQWVSMFIRRWEAVEKMAHA